MHSRAGSTVQALRAAARVRWALGCQRQRRRQTCSRTVGPPDPFLRLCTLASATRARVLRCCQHDLSPCELIDPARLPIPPRSSQASPPGSSGAVGARVPSFTMIGAPAPVPRLAERGGNQLMTALCYLVRCPLVPSFSDQAGEPDDGQPPRDLPPRLLRLRRPCPPVSRKDTAATPGS